MGNVRLGVSFFAGLIEKPRFAYIIALWRTMMFSGVTQRKLRIFSGDISWQKLIVVSDGVNMKRDHDLLM